MQPSSSRRWRALVLALAGTAIAVVAGTAGALAADRFTDVPDDHVFADEIDWMAATGISEGFPDGTFRPDAAVTRQAMAAFMQRLAGADPDVAPVVDAASLGGTAAEELLDELAALRAQVAELEAVRTQVTELEALLAGATRDGDRLVLSGVNLQVVNGTGTTDGTPNGLGNVIIGYDTERTTGGASDKSGSHYLVVGDGHNYTSHTGIVAGNRNTVSGAYGSVLAGFNNTAGSRASVVAGQSNTATGNAAAVLSGVGNEATGPGSSVAGGYGNAATYDQASVSGGANNTASGYLSTILGGLGKSVDAQYGCHPDC